jgi:hypothetical protein
MLTLWGNRAYSMCDGYSRRDFLTLGALGLGGLTLSDLLRLKAQGAIPSKTRPKSVIMVYLPGGPSHVDTFDPKPDAPVEFRGELKTIDTKVPGARVSELLPRLAGLTDRFSIVRTVKFAGPHECNELVTGVSARDRVKRPAFGSVLSKLRGDTGALPPYISLGYWTVGGGSGGDPEYPAYLGSAHWPFRPGATGKTAKGARGDGMDNLTLPPNVTAERMAERRPLRQALDSLRAEMDDPNGTLAGVDSFTAQALEMLSSPKAREAFDISREPEKTREKYGAATNLLLARRLVESGVAVVTVPLPGGSWDHHQNIFPSLRKQVPILDQGLYGLITDLYERGMDKDVSVVVWGEFGRQPRIGAEASDRNKNGRAHWPEVGFALLIGGGLKMGQVIGETDERGERAKGRPLNPRNVLATLYHALGIDPAMTFPNHSGRPTYLLDDREPIEALL